MVSHLWDHYGTSKRYFDRNRPQIRGQIRAFVKGINDFYAAHPADIPSWWGNRKIDECMVVAFARLFLYAWSTGQASGKFDPLRIGMDSCLREIEGLKADLDRR